MTKNDEENQTFNYLRREKPHAHRIENVGQQVGNVDEELVLMSVKGVSVHTSPRIFSVQFRLKFDCEGQAGWKVFQFVRYLEPKDETSWARRAKSDVGGRSRTHYKI
jgi:hypothetical protein